VTLIKKKNRNLLPIGYSPFHNDLIYGYIVYCLSNSVNVVDSINAEDKQRGINSEAGFDLIDSQDRRLWRLKTNRQVGHLPAISKIKLGSQC